MSDEDTTSRCFIDSNVWLYILLRGQDVTKADIAADLIRSKGSNIILSTQVINEVVNTIIKHAAMSEPEIRELIRRFHTRYTVQPITESIQLNASQLRGIYSLSHWDSLIVAAALESGASVLHTEDMHNGLVVEKQLTIVNPFIH